MTSERSNRDSILSHLFEEFRAFGFDGLSLSRISEVTGLGKASLYHHFPGGKAEMAEAVLDLAGDWLQTHVLQPLNASKEAPEQRLNTVLDAFLVLYENGEKSCVLEVMSIGGVGPVIQGKVQTTLQSLLSGFERLSQDAGFSKAEAKQKAEMALAAVQGGLVLSRGLADRKPFMRAIRRLRDGFLIQA